MSAKLKAIIMAVLMLLSAAFGWYIAYSDNDPDTVPDTGVVIEAGKNVVDVVTSDEFDTEENNNEGDASE